MVSQFCWCCEDCLFSSPQSPPLHKQHWISKVSFIFNCRQINCYHKTSRACWTMLSPGYPRNDRYCYSQQHFHSQWSSLWLVLTHWINVPSILALSLRHTYSPEEEKGLCRSPYCASPFPFCFFELVKETCKTWYEHMPLVHTLYVLCNSYGLWHHHQG